MSEGKRVFTTCNKCGWVHFSFTLARVQEEVDNFNKYYNTLSEQDKEYYYGGQPSTIEQYTECFSCGNSYRDFRESNEDEMPYGSTIQPILHYEEEYDEPEK